jgi:hypothetical protein
MTYLQQNKKHSSVTFNCFSPPVMLATMIVETILIIYTLFRYKLSSVGRLAVLSLISLAVFQLSEYFVCTGFGLRAEQWSRLGFILITALPALGIHLLHVLAGKKSRVFVYMAYAFMTAFMVFFLTYHAAFIGHQCTGNYVIFQLGTFTTVLYSIYYYGLLVAGIATGIRWANQLKVKGKAFYDQLQTIRALIIGYLVFLVPTALVYSIKPSARRGIPSIMCGFAVIYALILTMYILPRSKAKEYDYIKRPTTKAKNIKS